MDGRFNIFIEPIDFCYCIIIFIRRLLTYLGTAATTFSILNAIQPNQRPQSYSSLLSAIHQECV